MSLFEVREFFFTADPKLFQERTDSPHISAFVSVLKVCVFQGHLLKKKTTIIKGICRNISSIFRSSQLRSLKTAAGST